MSTQKLCVVSWYAESDLFSLCNKISHEQRHNSGTVLLLVQLKSFAVEERDFLNEL